MISFSDKEYIETKQVKLGKAKIEAPFNELSSKIEKKYKVKPLNIHYDYLKHNGKPRIQIIFDKYIDQKKFQSRGIFPDKTKQIEIIEMLHSLELFKSNYPIDEILVLFSSFEPIAKQEANNSIPENRIEELKTSIDNPNLWAIWRSFSTATFFFYTKAQVEEAQKSILPDLTDAYYNLIKKYDTFDYLNRNDFYIDLDDKEKFDTVYRSNWFYYSKDH